MVGLAFNKWKYSGASMMYSNNINDVVLVVLLLTLNIFHTIF